jgi:tRNA(fMet)-specific endonuclease VapC
VRILDTDTCVEILRGNDGVIERRATVEDDVTTTWITAAELHYGAAKSIAPHANHGLVERFLDSLDILGLDRTAARIFGDTKALLLRAGLGLADADLLIGAVALAQRATVVTGNTGHFERIPGLLLEDWIRG